MAPLSHKKDCRTSKLCFTHKDQSGRLNFELSYNERSLVAKHFPNILEIPETFGALNFH